MSNNYYCFLKKGKSEMRRVLVVLAILVLVSCAEHPYRGNYYGENRYVPTPYYGGYGYGYGAIYQGGYGGGYRGGYRDHDYYRGYRRGHEGGERGGYRDDDNGYRGGDRR